LTMGQVVARMERARERSFAAITKHSKGKQICASHQ
jgi:hypothetical protein